MRITDLREWSGGGWVWYVDREDGSEPTQYRTNRMYEGLWRGVPDGPRAGLWDQICGTGEFSLPRDEERAHGKLRSYFARHGGIAPPARMGH